MSANDALITVSVPDALTRYYDAKEREESAVIYINDAYLEVLNSLEKLERENARLRELAKGLYEFAYAEYPSAAKAGFADDLRELGVEVD